MTENQHRSGANSLKVRLFNSFGLQSHSDGPLRSASLPTTNASSRCYVKSGSRRILSNTIKRGWLRKQSGLLMRSWQLRWFVLRNGNLIQYTTNEESQPPVSFIALKDYVLKELPIDNSNEEQTRYLFEISQSTGGSNTSLRTSDTLILSADFEDDRRDWMRVIKQAMYSENGGAIFGQSLDATMVYEQERNPTRQIPEIVEMCVNHIRATGMDAEGLFRLPGRNKIVKELRDAFDVGGTRPSFGGVDVHTVASLLKAYLRDLPHPIVPVDHYDNVMKIITRQRPLDQAGAIKALSAALLQLPLNNRVLLMYLCKFLNEVALHSDLNKMTASNLATVFCPCFVEPEVDDPALLAGTSTNRATAVFDMISEFDKIFPVEEEDFSDQQSEGGDSYHTCSAYNTPMPETLPSGPDFPNTFTLDELDCTGEFESDLLMSKFEKTSLSNGDNASSELSLSSLGQHDASHSASPTIRYNGEQFQETYSGEGSTGPDPCIESDIHGQVIRLKEQLLARDNLVDDLQQQLAHERGKRKKDAMQYKKLAVKLAEERHATAEAVKRVIDLQSQLEKYSLKYGPVD